MEVVVGATALLEPATGIGIYTDEIARRLPGLLPGNRWSYHLSGGRFQAELPVPPAPDADAVASAQPIAPVTRAAQLRRAIGTLPIVGPALREHYHRLRRWCTDPPTPAHDLYWEPNNILDPAVRSRTRLVTVHDFSWRHHPEWHPRERIDHFNRHFLRSLRSADHIITGSHHAKAEILALGVADAHVTVIHHGVDALVFRRWGEREQADFRRCHGLERPFVLCVGTIEPRKNLLGLLQAWSRMPADVRDVHDLVIVGAKGWGNAAIHAAIAALGQRCRVFGYVSRGDLPGFYSTASAFAYPSFYEGFGLPPVEAAVCGCPVMVSAGLPALEVLGPSPGVEVCQDPHDLEALAAALARCIRGPRPTVAAPTWEAAALGHARCIERLLPTAVDAA